MTCAPASGWCELSVTVPPEGILCISLRGQADKYKQYDYLLHHDTYYVNDTEATIFIATNSLRRHYPDQVLRV